MAHASTAPLPPPLINDPDQKIFQQHHQPPCLPHPALTERPVAQAAMSAPISKVSTLSAEERLIAKMATVWDKLSAPSRYAALKRGVSLEEACTASRNSLLAQFSRDAQFELTKELALMHALSQKMTSTETVTPPLPNPTSTVVAVEGPTIAQNEVVDKGFSSFMLLQTRRKMMQNRQVLQTRKKPEQRQ